MPLSTTANHYSSKASSNAQNTESFYLRENIVSFLYRILVKQRVINQNLSFQIELMITARLGACRKLSKNGASLDMGGYSPDEQVLDGRQQLQLVQGRSAQVNRGRITFSEL